MPTQETRTLDNIIASRRALLLGGGAALAALGLNKPANAAATVSTYTDNDILNFALNLEYLEANFYYLAAFGTTIDVASTASTAAGAPVLAISGVLGSNTAGGNTTTGIVANTGLSTATAASYKVPFVSPVLAAYAVETAVEEAKHVQFLRSALNSGTTPLAVAQPLLNLTPALFTTLATAAMTGVSGFSPYLNEAYFLVGAYIFEDVGVSAYHGAAPLITNKTTILPAAVGIHAVEAYHAGLVRTSITAADAAATYLPAGSLAGVTQAISKFRYTASAAAAPSTAGIEDPNPDDYGTTAGTTGTGQSVTLNSSTAVSATQIVDCTPQSFAAPATGFGRTTTQVLNIVTAGGAITSGVMAKGGFFPNGLNGLFI